jgi:predicted ATPase/class 3 adenylate cyclase
MTSNLPSGTVTFLFTDIEGSTQLWEGHPEAMQTALARHDDLLRKIIETQGGYIIKTTGDGLHAVFERVTEGVAAALICQQALVSEAWPGLPGPLRVRMGLHTGEAELREGDYYGSIVNRTARLMSLAAGGQTLLSSATAELIRGQLHQGAALADLGEQRLKDLNRPEHVFQLNGNGLPDDFPPLRSLNTLPNNLPVQLTSFIGREKEVAEIKGLLNTARLVTLTGSGGTGKTRLAQEAGAQELTNFPHGVWLVELAPLSDPSQIIPEMAQVFGLKEIPLTPINVLVTDYLRDKKILLILDNCEHLIEACARLADDLLHQCMGLKILTSSREALGIVGEVAYHIPSLVDSEATQLFVERACAANPNFHLTEHNASFVAQICFRLDGIPLAIELAAARARLLSPEQIAARLDDRFRLLVGGSRTALPRQQTLRALIDWSYDLLSDEEKRLLQFASVFVSGWTLEALEAVADDPNAMDHLEQLINKSLVVTAERQSEMRYFMLETIRQYAREKLFEAQQSSVARDRHFAYFDDLSEKMWDAFRSADIFPLRERVDDEVENFRAALEWGLEKHVEETVRLAANFCVISSWMSNPAEGVEMAELAIERVKTLPPVVGEAEIQRQKLIARAFFTRGIVGLGQGNISQVMQALKEAIAISRATGDKQILGYSLEMYYTATTFINAPDGAEAAQEGLHIFSHELDDKFGLGMAYLNMARLASGRDDEDEKQRYFEKLKELIREGPVSYQVGMFFMGMGMDESARGNYQAAKNFFEDSLDAFRRIRNTIFQLVVRSEFGHVARHMGDLTQAKSIYRETLQGWQNFGNRAAIAHQLECFGLLAIADEEPQRAIKLFGAAEALREKIQSPMTDHERVEYDQAVSQLRLMLAEAEFNTLWTDGRATPMEQAIQLALS